MMVGYRPVRSIRPRKRREARLRVRVSLWRKKEAAAKVR